ncbi:MAG: precorrin-6Y C5,15-methyltransferase [Verrucomicrobiaceae bacterium]|nr:precorrin-6Y C5,15-methyltransferase [Verrucomicrobiaceae bacterium]
MNPPSDTPTSAARWLTIIGIGEDGYAELGKAARAALRAATVIFGSPRQLALLPNCIVAKQQPWPSPFALTPVLEQRGTPTCVLASGDPMLFGVGASLSKQIPSAEINVLPAPSSYSLAAARLGWALQDVELLSLVARPVAALNIAIFAGARLLILSNDGSSPRTIAALLNERGFGASKLTVLEHLGGEQERRINALAQQWSLDKNDAAALNIVAVECVADVDARHLALTVGLPDSAFRHDGQLTKRDVRAITLARLAPQPGELLWDVGAGCGSIGIEWMRAHRRCRAIAIEANTERQQLIEHNRDALGVPALRLINGEAPRALAGLETPDAIFIGGGVTVPDVLETCWRQLRGGGRLIANAVTLQSEMVLHNFRAQHGGELIRITVAQAQPLGEFDTWRAALPITLLEIHKPR